MKIGVLGTGMAAKAIATKLIQPAKRQRERRDRSVLVLLPQAIQLVTGMDPLDPEFRHKWIACLEWIGGRLQGPATSGATDHTAPRGNQE